MVVRRERSNNCAAARREPPDCLTLGMLRLVTGWNLAVPMVVYLFEHKFEPAHAACMLTYRLPLPLAGAGKVLKYISHQSSQSHGMVAVARHQSNRLLAHTLHIRRRSFRVHSCTFQPHAPPMVTGTTDAERRSGRPRMVIGACGKGAGVPLGIGSRFRPPVIIAPPRPKAPLGAKIDLPAFPVTGLRERRSASRRGRGNMKCMQNAAQILLGPCCG